jgi:hypothetical protein
MEHPEWWDWELAFTPHVELRMEEREFTELELRRMLDHPTSITPGRFPGRFQVATRFHGGPWIVVLEPDSDDRLVWVVTAFPLES